MVFKRIVRGREVLRGTANNRGSGGEARDNIWWRGRRLPWRAFYKISKAHRSLCPGIETEIVPVSIPFSLCR
tara:strand:- start:265 stop:480 length:216 start_codon:yes stop_codon:yes gene_type:complete